MSEGMARNIVHIELARRDQKILTSPDGKNIQVALDAVVSLVNDVEASAKKYAAPPPEAAEGTRYREGWCNWQAVSVRLFHHVNATWDEVRDELDRSEARVRALEAALGEACVQIMPLVIQKHGGNAPPDACDRDLCGRLAVWRALLAVRASDARPEGR